MSNRKRNRSLDEIKRARLMSRLSPTEKANYLHLIYKESAAGLSIAQIAEKLEISTASVYRWLRQRDDIQHNLNKSSIKNKIHIEEALEIIYNNGNVNSAVSRDALFQFLTWIRWPSSPEYHIAAMISCTTTYLISGGDTKSILDLDVADAAALSKYLSLDVIARFTSPYAAFNPDFSVVTNAKTRYDDRQFYAEIIAYLLSDNLTGQEKAHRPSLQNLQLLVEKRSFSPDWIMSERTFEKYWRSRAPSFPFLYVEQYHSGFDWSLNPQDSDFAQSVDELLQASDAMLEYLGKVKWVIQRLTTVLDPRAVRHIAFPKLPDGIEAVPVDTPQLSRRLRAKIAAHFY